MRTAQTAGGRRSDEGFTLIELLVVILIISILAAIAIPVFLNQRRSSYDAAAKADLRQAAEFEELNLVDQSTYANLATLRANGYLVRTSPDVTLTLVTYDGATGYCLSAKHAQSSATWYWDPQAGGQQAKGSAGCPVSTAGAPGDALP